MPDFLIVGCGLTGSVIARSLAEEGHRVKIVERRNHIGGNMYDYIDEHGFLVHKYGPHCFHTNDKELCSFMTKYEEWHPYRIYCKAEIDGKVTPSPFNFQTIDDYYPHQQVEQLKTLLIGEYPDREFVTVVEALDSPIREIKEYAEFLFEKDYSLYTAKQWGMPPSEIDPSVLKRVPLRLSYKDGYFDDEYQIMPNKSYESFFKRLLNHSNICMELNVDALSHITIDNEKKRVLYDGKAEYVLIYTGALDELFNCCYGKLPYRSLRFEWKYENIESFQDAPLVAYPQADSYTRIVEYKKMTGDTADGTSYAVEYPVPYMQGENVEPYYPVLTDESTRLYEMYKKLANTFVNLEYCGRLADFKYYNMDQALQRALDLIKGIKIKYPIKL